MPKEFAGERIRMGKKVVKGIGLLLCGAAFLWFCLPLLKDGYGLGSILGQLICIAGALLIIFYKRLVQKSSARRIFARCVAGFYIAGLCWCGYLTYLMNSVQHQQIPENTNIVLLGAQVLDKDRMSLALACRVDAAFDYLSANPQARCIVTGGQGWDEPVTEASVEKYFLVKMGISQDRIYEEDKSKSTKENLLFSQEIIKQEGLGNSIAVVTQEFHLFRSMKLAESLGYRVYGVPAKSDVLLFPAFYGRELFSLTKWHIEVLLGV